MNDVESQSTGIHPQQRFKNPLTKLVTKAQCWDFRKELEGALKQVPEGTKERVVLESLQSQLNEEMSVGDWARMGTVLGLLWYKFDLIIQHLNGIKDNTFKTANASRK